MWTDRLARMPIDPSSIVKFSYAQRIQALADDIEQNSRDGTPIPTFHQAVRRVALGVCDLLIEMARDVDAKLAALPQTRETFDRRTDDTPGGRNPFGY